MTNKRKILLVDDEKIIRMTLSRKLRNTGYEVTLAENGEQAKELIDKNVFDLIITDVVMKEVSGIEVLHHVKEVSPDTVVILITGYGSMESVVEALRQGAHDYIVKPCDNEEVLMRIAKGIEKKDILEQLKVSQNKLALSQLAVAINHEINSPLTVMIGNTEILLRQKNELSQKTANRLKKIIEAGNQIKNIVSKLRDIKDAAVIKYADYATMIDITSMKKSTVKKGSILIADDEDLILDLFDTVLEEDYSIETAKNGNELLKIAKETFKKGEKFDLYFLDLYMPGKNGLETFRELKKLDPKVKVCLITGYINDDLVKQAMSEGALGYLYKPFKVSDLVNFTQKSMSASLKKK